MNWYFKSLKKYATFTGRARRKEYWVFTSINFLVLCFWNVLANVMNPDFVWVGVFFIVMVFLPSIAVHVRRLHDTDHSGGWLLLNSLPILGVPFFLYFTLRNSSDGENRYGKNPKGLGDNNKKDFDKSIGNTFPEKTIAPKLSLHSKDESSKEKHKNEYPKNIPEKTMVFPNNNPSDNLKNDNSPEIESKFYEQAWHEVEKETYDIGLWAKVFAVCDGDEKQAKARYIKNRVVDLQNKSKIIIKKSESKDPHRKKTRNSEYTGQSFRQVHKDFSEELRKIERRTLNNMAKIRHQ